MTTTQSEMTSVFDNSSKHIANFKLGQNVILKCVTTDETVEGKIGFIWKDDDNTNAYVFVPYTGEPLSGEPFLWGPNQIELEFMKYATSYDVLNNLGIIRVTSNNDNYKIMSV